MSEYLNRCHFGDVRAVLRQMIADGVKVNCIVTSPPYWGLRSYLQADHADKSLEIGSEPTLKEFITTMTEVFMLAREVLADDGTCWINMGDCYSSHPGQRKITDKTGDKQETNEGSIGSPSRSVEGLKAKDLCGQPWRLAFALQDGTCRCNKCGLEQATSLWPVHNGHRICVPCLIAGDAEAKVLPAYPGWWLRQDIIWSKPNPMPESVTDRCTKAHEYLFLMTKAERYYWDAEAMRERAVAADIGAMDGGAQRQADGTDANDGRNFRLAGNVNPPKGQMAYESGDDRHRTKAGLLAYAQRQRSKADSFKREGSKRAEVIPGQTVGTHRAEREESAYDTFTRNRRSVWTVPTQPYAGSHFAVFPTKLIEPCILAGCPVGGTVLDIFMGSGTTAMVAERLGRKWIGIDIDERNDALQRERLRQPSLDLEAA